jgi:hypothetical protein
MENLRPEAAQFSTANQPSTQNGNGLNLSAQGYAAVASQVNPQARTMDLLDILGAAHAQSARPAVPQAAQFPGDYAREERSLAQPQLLPATHIPQSSQPWSSTAPYPPDPSEGTVRNQAPA